MEVSERKGKDELRGKMQCNWTPEWGLVLAYQARMLCDAREGSLAPSFDMSMGNLMMRWIIRFPYSAPVYTSRNEVVLTVPCVERDETAW